MIGEWLLGAERASARFDSRTAFRVSAPHDDLTGGAEWQEIVAAPLLGALGESRWHTAMELRSKRVDGAWQAAAWGTLVGTLQQPWCGIEPTGLTVAVRVGAVVDFDESRAVRCTVMLDVPDLAEQAGQRLVRRPLGDPARWPVPSDDRASADVDDEQSAATLAVVMAMQSALHDSARTRSEMLAAPHLAYWHDDFVWAGPGGIGTTVGAAAFVDCHQLPFRASLPDRVGGGALPSSPAGGAAGHFVKFADGRFAVTGGWPSVTATHGNDGWLGLPATGRRVTLRVFDFYEVVAGRIAMNWVFIDLVDFLRQIGQLPTLAAATKVSTKGSTP
jgi:hypothetical protein